MLTLVCLASRAFYVPPLAPPSYGPVVAHRASSPLLSADDIADGSDMSTLFASLLNRQKQLESQLSERWRKAKCASSVKLALPTWIRRLDVQWPRAAIGTADGGIFFADLSTGEVLARKLRAHPAQVEGSTSARDMRLLYGDYDGGGLTAIAYSGTRIVSAGRDGGAKLWRVGRPSPERPEELMHVADMHTAGQGASAIVSSIYIASGNADGGAAADSTGDEEEDDGTGGSGSDIWLGSLDGRVRRFSQKASVDGGIACTLTLRASSPVLGMAVDEKAGLVVAGTADGSVAVYNMNDGKPCGVWRAFAFDGSRGYRGSSARSVALTTVGDKYVVVAGGGDGMMQMRTLADDPRAPGGCFDFKRQPTQLLPSHNAACVALQPVVNTLRIASSVASADGSGSGGGGESVDGLLLSGGHDGTLRVWDLDATLGSGERRAKPLFALAGYKVWLGSIWTDGQRIISDGRDNVVVVHDFSSEAVQAAEVRNKKNKNDDAEQA